MHRKHGERPLACHKFNCNLSWPKRPFLFAPRSHWRQCRGVCWALVGRWRLRSGREEIADADLGEDVARMQGIGLDLVPQAVDVHLEHVPFTDVFGPPDML